MLLFLDACPTTDVCTPGVTLTPEAASWGLILFIVACCVAPFLFGGGRRG